MSKLLRTSLLALAGYAAGCSIPKQQTEKQGAGIIGGARIASVTKSTEEQVSGALNDKPESTSSEKISLRYAQYKLDELMDLLDVKKFSQIENASSYIFCIQKLLNEVKKRGIVDFGKDLALDSVISNDDIEAIIAFQHAFNNLLPAGNIISVDGKIGKETIGAILTVLSGEFNENTPNLTLEIFYVSSHNQEYYAQKRREWEAKDKIYEKNRRFFESLDQEKVKTYTRQILNLTPQSGHIVLPDDMNSAEAGMALWDVWSSTENEQHFNDLISNNFAIYKLQTCSRLPKVILSVKLRKVIEKEIIPYLQGLYSWGNAPFSPTNFLKSLITK